MAFDPLAGQRVLGFDLETTGFDPRRNRIVQYALIGSDREGQAVHLESLVNPRMRIPAEVSRIHGIYDADVIGEGEFKEHAAAISAAMEGAIIVGHNVERFDWPFLRAEFTRAGVSMPRPAAMLDTLRIAKRLKVPPRHNLGALCSRYSISLENAHTAGADAAATLLLLHKLMAANPQHFRGSIEQILDWIQGNASRRDSADRLGPGIEDLPPIDGSLGWLRTSVDGMIIARGRNRGRSVVEIQASDPSYLDWLSSAAGPLEADAVAALTQARG
jgi:DNA polymerase-3 subunit epsilon